MLHVIVGTDPATRAAVRRREWKGALEDLDPRTLLPEALAGIAATSSLFAEPRGYRLWNVFGGEGLALDGDALLGVAPALAASPHTFILEEDKLLAKSKAALEKVGASVAECKAAPKKEPFNVFALGSALEKSDRKALWLGLMAAHSAGAVPENLAGILAWKARILAASARGAEKERWSRVSRQLVVMYHESHRGAGELGLLLERFALTL